ncbi:hypothetical protein R1flu_022614 [Riccia fluitans]|uniref:Uncharacterized protein n=1 Tax=Riccia fluitans TaxID=41844 RepID=A0ABD1XPP2_9MARC
MGTRNPTQTGMELLECGSGLRIDQILGQSKSYPGVVQVSGQTGGMVVDYSSFLTSEVLLLIKRMKELAPNFSEGKAGQLVATLEDTLVEAQKEPKESLTTNQKTLFTHVFLQLKEDRAKLEKLILCHHDLI